jgi:hypothetical protein
MTKKKVGTMIVVMLIGTTLLSACGTLKVPITLVSDETAGNTLTIQLPNNGARMTTSISGTVSTTVTIDTNKLTQSTGTPFTVSVDKLVLIGGMFSQPPVSAGIVCASTRDIAGGVGYLRTLTYNDLQLVLTIPMVVSSDKWTFPFDLNINGRVTGITLNTLINIYIQGTGFKIHQVANGTVPSNVPVIGGSTVTLDITLISRDRPIGVYWQCDADDDGITDRIENQLLQRFSPFYLFEQEPIYDITNPYKPIFLGYQSEKYRPLDPNLYIGTSLIHACYPCYDASLGGPAINYSEEYCAPNSFDISYQDILGCRSDDPCNGYTTKHYVNNLTNNPTKQTNICLSPNVGIEYGADWSTILQNKNIGLFGHVVRANTDYQRGVPQKNGSTYRLYKIEYWQFFGYNDAEQIGGIGNHESDWTTVQLLYDPVTDKKVSVFHYAHGGEMRYDFDSSSRGPYYNYSDDWGGYEEYQGKNYSTNNIHSIDLSPTAAQDNQVRFAKDPVTGEYSHPLVYLEHGSHEFYPTQWGVACKGLLPGDEAFCSPPHNGNDTAHSYLTTNIPNIGEVEDFYLSRNNQNILQFNGYWGCHGNNNKPPPGPTLHTEWTYPADSTIRPLLEGQLEN